MKHKELPEDLGGYNDCDGDDSFDFGARDPYRNEWRVLGPPGTGKTTWLCRQVHMAMEKYDPYEILVASFTRTAAQEIAARANLPLSDRVGTLHSICYKLVGAGSPIADRSIGSWNQWCKENDVPDLQFEAANGEPEGLWAQSILMRATMTWPKDTRALPVEMQRFWLHWNEWKSERGCVEFQDLIDKALTVLPPPGVKIIFLDEAQDFSVAELALVRKWGQHADKLVLLGDDDQCIYTFKGASPKSFVASPIPCERTIVLAQSHRVPRAVFSVASSITERMSFRAEKEYSPTDFYGSVERHPFNLKHAERVAMECERACETGTCMLLASCVYMLQPVVAELRKRGLPFWNPFQLERAELNPLAKAEDRTSAKERLISFLKIREDIMGGNAKPWTFADVALWSDPCKVSMFVKHGKGKDLSVWGIAENMKDEPFDRWEVFREDAPEGLLYGDADAYISTIPEAKRAPYHYAWSIVSRYGVKALTDEPRLIVGTFHSVKGAEADTVILSPDISPRAAQNIQDSDVRDAALRGMYVGVTRTKKTLVLLAPASKTYVRM